MKRLKIINIFIASIVLSGCTQEECPIPEPKDDICNEAILDEENTDSFYVNLAEAGRVVSRFTTDFMPSKMLSRSSGFKILYDSNGNPSMYVMNFSGGGFMIISAVKDLTPVLAYDKNNSFDTDNLNPGVQNWVEEISTLSANPSFIIPDSAAVNRKMWKYYEFVSQPSNHLSRYWESGDIDESERQILQAVLMDSVSTWTAKGYTVYTLDELQMRYPEKYDEIDELALNSIWPEYEGVYRDFTVILERPGRYDHTDTGILVKTKWDQIYPYNYSFPLLSNGVPAYVGCVPVAIGQIMCYHNYPSTINWNAMPITDTGMESLESFILLSTFLRNIAALGTPNYDLDGTKIDFDKSIDIFSSYNYMAKLKDWDLTTAVNNVNSKRPVLVCGENLINHQHHAYIMDGVSHIYVVENFEVWTFRDRRRFGDIYIESTPFTSTSFHYNWGQNGKHDAYYINPGVYNLSSNEVYQNQYMVVDICPKK